MGIIADVNRIAIGKGIDERQGKAVIDRAEVVGAILKLECGDDGSAVGATSGETKGAANGEAAGREDAVSLGRVGRNRSNAGGRQESGDQVGIADVARVAQAEADGNGFSVVNRTIGWREALDSKGGAGSNNANEGRGDLGGDRGGIVAGIGVRLSAGNRGGGGNGAEAGGRDDDSNHGAGAALQRAQISSDVIALDSNESLAGIGGNNDDTRGDSAG